MDAEAKSRLDALINKVNTMGLMKDWEEQLAMIIMVVMTMVM